MGIIIHDRHSAMAKASDVKAEVLQIANQAFAAQQKGIATGDWADFLALLSDEVEFSAPSPHLPDGILHGKAAVAAQLHKFVTELNLRGELIQLKPIVMNDTTVAVEFLANGQLAGEHVTHPMAVFYDIEQGKVTRFREYIGRI